MQYQNLLMTSILQTCIFAKTMWHQTRDQSNYWIQQTWIPVHILSLSYPISVKFQNVPFVLINDVLKSYIIMFDEISIGHLSYTASKLLGFKFRLQRNGPLKGYCSSRSFFELFGIWIEGYFGWDIKSLRNVSKIYVWVLPRKETLFTGLRFCTKDIYRYKYMQSVI